MSPDRRIYHPDFGWAIVTGLKGKPDGTVEALADFGWSKRFLSISEFRHEPEGSALPPSYWVALGDGRYAHLFPQTGKSAGRKASAGTAKSGPERERRKSERPEHAFETAESRALQGITALRLGQMLEHDVEALSVGTKHIKAELETRIDDALHNKPSLILVEGPWGGGKTHSLSLAQAIAQRDGMATVNVVLDGQSAALWDPKGLLPQIACAIRYPGNPTPSGVENHLNQLVKKRKARALVGGEVAEALDLIPLEAVDDPEVVDLLEHYLAGMPGVLGPLRAALKPYIGKTALRLPINCPKADDWAKHFADLLAWWAKFTVATGAHGLLVVLDELDVEYAVAKGQKAANQRTEVIRALRQLAKQKLPLVVLLGAVPGSSDSWVEDPVEHPKRVLKDALTCLQAPDLTDDELKTLFGRICDQYGKAYPDLTVPKIRSDALAARLLRDHKRNPGSVTRHLVRAAIEAMDALSFEAI